MSCVLCWCVAMQFDERYHKSAKANIITQKVVPLPLPALFYVLRELSISHGVGHWTRSRAHTRTRSHARAGFGFGELYSPHRHSRRDRRHKTLHYTPDTPVNRKYHKHHHASKSDMLCMPSEVEAEPPYSRAFSRPCGGGVVFSFRSRNGGASLVACSFVPSPCL